MNQVVTLAHCHNLNSLLLRIAAGLVTGYIIETVASAFLVRWRDPGMHAASGIHYYNLGAEINDLNAFLLLFCLSLLAAAAILYRKESRATSVAVFLVAASVSATLTFHIHGFAEPEIFWFGLRLLLAAITTVSWFFTSRPSIALSVLLTGGGLLVSLLFFIVM